MHGSAITFAQEMKRLLFPLLIGICGCTKQTSKDVAESRGCLRIEDVRSQMMQAEGWVTTFTSRAGVYEGMDSDTILSFLDGGRVSMIECGIAPVTYEGTFTVAGDGEISLHLPDYPEDWPKMKLRTVEGKILLFRSDEATGLEFGGRGGAVETPDMNPFWPFGISDLSWPEPEPEEEVDEAELGPLFPE
jgi:hypothetical protein